MSGKVVRSGYDVGAGAGAGALTVKVAVQTKSLAGIEKEAAHGAGDHPLKLLPLIGVAVNVITVPAA